MHTPNPPLNLPLARRDADQGYTLHGRYFADPYLWLERLNDAETEAWVAVQEAATHAVLDAVPGRAWLRTVVTRAMIQAPPASLRNGPHGQTFVWQADAL